MRCNNSYKVCNSSMTCNNSYNRCNSGSRSNNKLYLSSHTTSYLVIILLIIKVVVDFTSTYLLPLLNWKLGIYIFRSFQKGKISSPTVSTSSVCMIVAIATV